MPALLEISNGLFPDVGLYEFRTPCRIELRAAPLDDVPDIPQFEFLYIVGDEALVALVYTIDFYAFIYAFSYDGSYCGIHAGRIAAACQYCNFLHSSLR